MNRPSLDELLKKVDSKFTLITLVSKRARQLNIGAKRLVETTSAKPVSVALEEISANKIRARRREPKGGE